MACETCGSHNVTRREVEGHLLFECNLCGALEGDDAAIEHIELLRRGRERGFDDAITPLALTLESAEVFRIVQATGGDPRRNEAPSVMFRLTKNDTSYIEKLLRSIELANRKTKLRWLVELTLQNTIVYILRPRFWRPPSDIAPEDIEMAMRDLDRLARQLKRDLALSWWR